MADKPSRALVIYGDGMARSLGPAHNHLHSFASRACCGFLSLPNSPPSENEDARIIREFAELLDASEVYQDPSSRTGGESQDKKAPTVQERFMGLKAAIISNHSSLNSFGSTLGLSVLQPSSDSLLTASELLKLLGFQDGKVSETSPFELVMVHVKAGEKINNLQDVELVNHLVGELIQIAQSGSEIGSRLHMSVIMSYGPVQGDDSSRFSVLDERNRQLSLPYPRQSYTMKGGKPRENVRHHSPMLVAQWQNAVTRKDLVKEFSFKDFIENCGNLVIPADRLLHEVAFKLWKAPKYGA